MADIITHTAPPTPADNLHTELRALIASSRQRLAGAVNAELTRLYWSVGKRLHAEVLGDARAGYGIQLLDQLGQQLAQEFGRGFESRNLRRMVKFAECFPDAAIVSTLSAKSSRHKLQLVLTLTQFVATLSRHLSRSHFVNVLPLKGHRDTSFRISGHDQISPEANSFSIFSNCRPQVAIRILSSQGVSDVSEIGKVQQH